MQEGLRHCMCHESLVCAWWLPSRGVKLHRGGQTHRQSIKQSYLCHQSKEEHGENWLQTEALQILENILKWARQSFIVPCSGRTCWSLGKKTSWEGWTRDFAFWKAEGNTVFFSMFLAQQNFKRRAWSRAKWSTWNYFLCLWYVLAQHLINSLDFIYSFWFWTFHSTFPRYKDGTHTYLINFRWFVSAFKVCVWSPLNFLDTNECEIWPTLKSRSESVMPKCF